MLHQTRSPTLLPTTEIRLDPQISTPKHSAHQHLTVADQQPQPDSSNRLYSNPIAPSQITASAPPAPSFSSPYRKRLASVPQLAPSYVPEAFPIKASDKPDGTFIPDLKRFFIPFLEATTYPLVTASDARMLLAHTVHSPGRPEGAPWKVNLRARVKPMEPNFFEHFVGLLCWHQESFCF